MNARCHSHPIWLAACAALTATLLLAAAQPAVAQPGWVLSHLDVLVVGFAGPPQPGCLSRTGARHVVLARGRCFRGSNARDIETGAALRVARSARAQRPQRIGPALVLQATTKQERRFARSRVIRLLLVEFFGNTLATVAIRNLLHQLP